MAKCWLFLAKEEQVFFPGEKATKAFFYIYKAKTSQQCWALSSMIKVRQNDQKIKKRKKF